VTLAVTAKPWAVTWSVDRHVKSRKGGVIMKSALHITTKVLPGNRVEVEIPAGSVGEDIEVIVVLPDQSKPSKQNVLELLANAHQIGTFRTPEEIDRDLHKDRNT
jgi:hypothetical protein